MISNFNIIIFMGNIQFKDCCTSNNIDINDYEPEITNINEDIKMVKNKNNYKTTPGPPIFI